jgi:hypothetical protein
VVWVLERRDRPGRTPSGARRYVSWRNNDAVAVEWVNPTEPLTDRNRESAVEYLDRQGRGDLAVWVRYRTGKAGASVTPLRIAEGESKRRRAV